MENQHRAIVDKVKQLEDLLWENKRVLLYNLRKGQQALNHRKESEKVLLQNELQALERSAEQARSDQLKLLGNFFALMKGAINSSTDQQKQALHTAYTSAQQRASQLAAKEMEKLEEKFESSLEMLQPASDAASTLKTELSQALNIPLELFSESPKFDRNEVIDVGQDDDLANEYVENDVQAGEGDIGGGGGMKRARDSESASFENAQNLTLDERAQAQLKNILPENLYLVADYKGGVWKCDKCHFRTSSMGWIVRHKKWHERKEIGRELLKPKAESVDATRARKPTEKVASMEDGANSDYHSSEETLPQFSSTSNKFRGAVWKCDKCEFSTSSAGWVERHKQSHLQKESKIGEVKEDAMEVEEAVDADAVAITPQKDGGADGLSEELELDEDDEREEEEEEYGEELVDEDANPPPSNQVEIAAVAPKVQETSALPAPVTDYVRLPWKCDLCDFTTTRLGWVSRHKASHAAKKPAKRPVAAPRPMAPSPSASISKPLASIPKEDDGEWVEKVDISPENEVALLEQCKFFKETRDDVVLYQCTLCRFNTQRLGWETAIFSAEGVKSEGFKVPLFDCPTCRWQYESKHQLERHFNNSIVDMHMSHPNICQDRLAKILDANRLRSSMRTEPLR